MKSTGTVLASSLNDEQMRNVLTPDQGGAGGDAAMPQMVAGGGKLRSVYDQAEKQKLQANAKTLCRFLFTELNGGNVDAAINLADQIIVECKKIKAQMQPQGD